MKMYALLVELELLNWQTAIRYATVFISGLGSRSKEFGGKSNILGVVKTPSVPTI